MKLLLNIIFYQAFKDAWEFACLSPLRTILQIPAENVYLVRPIDFAGPCKAKLTLLVCLSKLLKWLLLYKTHLADLPFPLFPKCNIVSFPAYYPRASM